MLAGVEATRRPSDRAIMEWIPRVRCVVGTGLVSCAARNGSGSAAMSEAAHPCRATAERRPQPCSKFGFKFKTNRRGCKFVLIGKVK